MPQLHVVSLSSLSSCLRVVLFVTCDLCAFLFAPPTARGRWPPSLILVLLELFLSTVAKCLLISRFCHFCSLHCKVPWDDYCCDSVKHKLQNSRTTFWLYGHWEMRRISTAAHCRNKVFKSVAIYSKLSHLQQKYVKHRLLLLLA